MNHAYTISLLNPQHRQGSPGYHPKSHRLSLWIGPQQVPIIVEKRRWVFMEGYFFFPEPGKKTWDLFIRNNQKYLFRMDQEGIFTLGRSQ